MSHGCLLQESRLGFWQVEAIISSQNKQINKENLYQGSVNLPRREFSNMRKAESKKLNIARSHCQVYHKYSKHRSSKNGGWYYGIKHPRE